MSKHYHYGGIMYGYETGYYCKRCNTFIEGGGGHKCNRNNNIKRVKEELDYYINSQGFSIEDAVMIINRKTFLDKQFIQDIANKEFKRTP